MTSTSVSCYPSAETSLTKGQVGTVDSIQVTDALIRSLSCRMTVNGRTIRSCSTSTQRAKQTRSSCSSSRRSYCPKSRRTIFDSGGSSSTTTAHRLRQQIVPRSTPRSTMPPQRWISSNWTSSSPASARPSHHIFALPCRTETSSTRTCITPAPLRICESHPLSPSHLPVPAVRPVPICLPSSFLLPRASRISFSPGGMAEKLTRDPSFSHRAHILLHEPHAKPDVAGCVSSRKTLNASRAILELIYMVAATNYDVSLLDLQAFVRAPTPHCSRRRDLTRTTQMCWFMAGRVLVRFLRAAIDNARHDQLIPLQREVSYVRCVACSRRLRRITHLSSAERCCPRPASVCP